MILSLPMTLFLGRAVRIASPVLNIDLVNVLIFVVGFQTVPIMISQNLCEALDRPRA